MNLSLTTIRANRRRRVLLGAGVATLAFSLALSIAPTLAKNSGTVKIHDVQAGTDIDNSLNDPHVCTFTAVFDYRDAPEAGTWQIVSWAPTGDGSQVAGGAYDSTGGALYETDVLALDAGHYQLSWQADGSHTSRHKTFWVECANAGGSSDESSPSPTADPSGDPGNDNGSAGADQSGSNGGTDNDGSADNGGTSGNDGGADNGGTSGNDGSADNSGTSGNGGSADNGGTSDNGGGADNSGTSGNGGSADNGGTSDNGGSADNGGTSDNGGSADNSGTSDNGAGAGGSDAGTSSQNGTSGGSHEGDVKGITSPVDGGHARLPNTAFDVPTQSLSAVLTVLGLLLVIAAHPFMRRSAHANRG